MYAYRKIADLLPNPKYEVVFDLEIPSKAREKSIGEGGSPGADVYVKVGATAQEPGRTGDQLNWYRMSVEKGNQAAEGSDMINRGTFGTTLDVFIYTIIRRSNRERPFRVRTNSLGGLWLMLGKDSGFESTTTLHYDNISVSIR
jgi:hypothetical protein